jgi:hypothetical protein
LEAAQRTSAALYPSHPEHTTARPAAERLLKALQELTLMIIRKARHEGYHLTSPFTFQQQILALQDFPVNIYSQLCADSHKPPSE